MAHGEDGKMVHCFCKPFRNGDVVYKKCCVCGAKMFDYKIAKERDNPKEESSGTETVVP